MFLSKKGYRFQGQPDTRLLSVSVILLCVMMILTWDYTPKLVKKVNAGLPDSSQVMLHYLSKGAEYDNGDYVYFLSVAHPYESDSTLRFRIHVDDYSRLPLGGQMLLGNIVNVSRETFVLVMSDFKHPTMVAFERGG